MQPSRNVTRGITRVGRAEPTIANSADSRTAAALSLARSLARLALQRFLPRGETRHGKIALREGSGARVVRVIKALSYGGTTTSRLNREKEKRRTGSERSPPSIENNNEEEVAITSGIMIAVR